MNGKNLHGAVALILKSSIKKSGLNPSEVAEKIGICRASVDNATSGRTLPESKNMRRWIKILPDLEGMFEYRGGQRLKDLTEKGLKHFEQLTGPGLAKTKPSDTNGSVRTRVAKSTLRADAPSPLKIGINIGVLSTVCSNSERWRSMLGDAHKSGMTLEQVVKSMDAAHQARPAPREITVQ